MTVRPKNNYFFVGESEMILPKNRRIPIAPIAPINMNLSMTMYNHTNESFNTDNGIAEDCLHLSCRMIKLYLLKRNKKQELSIQEAEVIASMTVSDMLVEIKRMKHLKMHNNLILKIKKMASQEQETEEAAHDGLTTLATLAAAKLEAART